MFKITVNKLSSILREKSQRMSIVQTRIVETYLIVGNQKVAIAININDPEDSHYFTIDPEVNNNAFIRACGWAYEPDPYHERIFDIRILLSKTNEELKDYISEHKAKITAERNARDLKNQSFIKSCFGLDKELE